MIKDTIEKEIIAAMKSGDKQTMNALKSFKADYILTAKNKCCEVTDEIVVDVATKSIKQYKDACASFKPGNALNDELFAEYNFRIKLLEKFLPAQLSEIEVMQIVLEAKALTNAITKRDMGKIMKEVQPKCKGRFDGKRLSEIVNSVLE